jgi:hypothetical protein
VLTCEPFGDNSRQISGELWLSFSSFSSSSAFSVLSCSLSPTDSVGVLSGARGGRPRRLICCDAVVDVDATLMAERATDDTTDEAEITLDAVGLGDRVVFADLVTRPVDTGGFF